MASAPSQLPITSTRPAQIGGIQWPRRSTSLNSRATALRCLAHCRSKSKAQYPRGRGKLGAAGKIVVDPPFPVGGVDVVGGREGIGRHLVGISGRSQVLST